MSLYAPQSFSRLLVATLIVFGLTGCGYTMSSRSDGFSGKAELLYIGTVESQLLPPQPHLAYDFTKRLKEEASVDRRFEIGPQTSAMVAARISLTRLREPTAVSDFQNDPTEINLAAEARVLIRSGGEVRQVSIAGYSSYAPGLGESREAGLDRLWRDLARNTLDAIADRDWLKPDQSQK